MLERMEKMRADQHRKDSQAAEQRQKDQAAMLERMTAMQAANAEKEREAALQREREQAEMFQRMSDMQMQMAQQEKESAAQAAAQQAKAQEMMMHMQQEHSEKMMEMMAQQRQADLEREQRFREFVDQNAAKAKELEQANLDLAKKLAQAEDKFYEEAGDPEQYEQKQVEIFQQFCDKVTTIPEVPKTVKPSVAVLGQNGVGKSSLINALIGQEVTPIGIIDTTKIVCKCYESDTTEFWDVPGCSEERSYANLRSIMAIKEMHFIMIVYIDRCEHITKLERMVIACKVPYVVVRNKIDNITDSEAKSNRFESRAKYLDSAYQDEKGKLQGDLIYVSAKAKENLDKLRQAPLIKGLHIKLSP